MDSRRVASQECEILIFPFITLKRLSFSAMSVWKQTRSHAGHYQPRSFVLCPLHTLCIATMIRWIIIISLLNAGSFASGEPLPLDHHRRLIGFGAPLAGPPRGPAGPPTGPAGPPKGLAGPPKGLAGPPKGPAGPPKGPAGPPKGPPLLRGGASGKSGRGSCSGKGGLPPVSGAPGEGCSASADCTDSATPMCSGGVYVAMSCGGGSFTPDGAYDFLWDSLKPMTGKYTINYFQHQEDLGCVHAE